MKNIINRPKKFKLQAILADIISYSCYIAIAIWWDWKLAILIWLILFTTGLRTYVSIVSTVKSEIQKQYYNPNKHSNNEKK